MKRLLIDASRAALALLIVGITVCFVVAMGICTIQAINPTLGACQ